MANRMASASISSSARIWPLPSSSASVPAGAVASAASRGGARLPGIGGGFSRGKRGLVAALAHHTLRALAVDRIAPDNQNALAHARILHAGCAELGHSRRSSLTDR